MLLNHGDADSVPDAVHVFVVADRRTALSAVFAYIQQASELK